MNRSDLHEYQEVAIKYIIGTPKCGLFLDMGLGKTISTLTAINYLMYEDFDISKALIVSPKRVCENVWPGELKKWEHVKHLKISVVAGDEKQRIRALQTPADIYSISRDNIAWLCGIYRKPPFDMLIVDESSSFKNQKSNRFKALRDIQPYFKRIVILTGTPIPNGLVDLWAQIYLLDRGERLGKFPGRFKRKFFNEQGRKGDIVFNYAIKGEEEEKAIHEKISDICISMKSSDYLDLPNRIDNIIEIPFSKNLLKRYENFKKEKILGIFEGYKKGDVISAISAGALSSKLLQFANGAVYDEDKDFHEMHSLKIEALEEIVEHAGGKPVLVAWSFRHDMYRIMEKLKKYNPRELKGSKDIDDWNMGKTRLMLMHPASGGHGLNLQEGGHIIVWFGQTWNSEYYEQFNARIARQGQTEKVIIHHLVAVDTLEKRVIKSLNNKIKKQDSLIKAVKVEIEKYLECF